MSGFAIAMVVITLALGTFSSLTFAWQWLVGTPTQMSSVVLLVLVGVVAAALFLYLKRRAPKTPPPRAGLPILLGIVGLFAVYWVVQCMNAGPLGRLDAAAIWNLHARFMYLGEHGSWKEVFDPILFWSHNDYPLLLPGLIDGAWMLAGSEQSIMPKLVAIWFGFASIAIVCSATCAVARDSRGWLLGLILLVTPSFVLQWPNQMADIPLSVYIVTTVALVQFAAFWPNLRFPMLALAGLSAGFAAWTKNEGLLLVAALLVSRGLAHVFLAAWDALRKNAHRRSHSRSDMLAIALGLVPLLVLIVGFKFFLAPPGDIRLDAAALARLPQLNRYREIATAFVAGFVSFGEAGQVGGTHPGILLVLYLLLFMARIRQVSVTSLSLLLVPPLMLAGHFMVYVITPHPLTWHLFTSLSRLILQLWPAVVFILATVQVAMTAEPANIDAEPAAPASSIRRGPGSPLVAHAHAEGVGR